MQASLGDTKPLLRQYSARMLSRKGMSCAPPRKQGLKAEWLSHRPAMPVIDCTLHVYLV